MEKNGTTNRTDSRTELRREARLRRRAKHRGLVLEKARIRNERVWGWQLFRIIDASTSTVVAGYAGIGYSMDLDEIEAYLAEGSAKNSKAQERE